MKELMARMQLHMKCVKSELNPWISNQVHYHSGNWQLSLKHTHTSSNRITKHALPDTKNSITKQLLNRTTLQPRVRLTNKITKPQKYRPETTKETKTNNYLINTRITFEIHIFLFRRIARKKIINTKREQKDNVRKNSDDYTSLIGREPVTRSRNTFTKYSHIYIFKKKNS